MTTFTEWQRDPVTGQVLFDTAGNPLAVPNPDALTYGTMQARVGNEALGRASAGDIRNAIQDAIAEYERESFFFNDMRTFNDAGLATINGKEFYSADDLPVLINMPHIRQIMVLAFANRYPLIQRTQQWIDDQSVSTSWHGLPTDWCWVGGALRLYPIPNGGYPLIITGSIRFPVVVLPEDVNPWMNEGERLIRSEAKRLIFTEINRDELQAGKMELEIYGNPQTGRVGALAQLRRETMRRQASPGRIRPSRAYV
jgi:hypothetical protein